MQIKIRILEATVVKYGSEAWALRKADEDLLDVFQRNLLQIVLGTRLTDRIPNSRLYEKCGLIPHSKALIRKRLRWLWHIMRTDDNILPNIVLFGEPFMAKQKAGLPQLRWEDIIKKDLKDIGTFFFGGGV